jgi:hypothetical protein
MENEIWLPSKNFDGVMVSSIGRIKLPSREIKMPNGGIKITNPKPTFGYKSKKGKNVVIMLVQNRIFGNIRVHIEVCSAFHGEKPFEKAVVMHLDENSMNNKAENLKWGTQKENLNAPKFIEYCKGRTGENSPVIKGRLKKNEKNSF